MDHPIFYIIILNLIILMFTLLIKLKNLQIKLLCKHIHPRNKLASTKYKCLHIIQFEFKNFTKHYKNQETQINKKPIVCSRSK